MKWIKNLFKRKIDLAEVLEGDKTLFLLPEATEYDAAKFLNSIDEAMKSNKKIFVAGGKDIKVVIFKKTNGDGNNGKNSNKKSI